MKPSNNLTSFTTTILCELEIQVGPDFYCMRRWARSEFSSFFFYLNIDLMVKYNFQRFIQKRDVAIHQKSWKCWCFKMSSRTHVYSNSWQMEGVIYLNRTLSHEEARFYYWGLGLCLSKKLTKFCRLCWLLTRYQPFRWCFFVATDVKWKLYNGVGISLIFPLAWKERKWRI